MAAAHTGMYEWALARPAVDSTGPLPEVSARTRAGRRRSSVSPGLTCLGRIDPPCREWMQLDLYYIEHRGLRLDLEILIRTIPAVLSCRGTF